MWGLKKIEKDETRKRGNKKKGEIKEIRKEEWQMKKLKRERWNERYEERKKKIKKMNETDNGKWKEER